MMDQENNESDHQQGRPEKDNREIKAERGKRIGISVCFTDNLLKCLGYIFTLINTAACFELVDGFLPAGMIFQRAKHLACSDSGTKRG